jgi:hypothetical protein
MMLQEPTRDPNDTEIANINVAADLLRRMLLQLQDLEVNNARLHFAVCDSGHAIEQRLNMLSGIAELLKEPQTPLRTRELSHRAKKLIFQLSSELEQLALIAEHEFESIS